MECPMTNQDLKVWFARNIEECMDSLYGLAVRLTRNSADAEDLVAETVVKGWSVIGTLEDRSRFRPWLLRILRNRYISDYRRKSARPPELSYDSMLADGTHDVTDLLTEQPDEFLCWWANPEQEFANKLLGEDIVRAIDKLPEVFRTVVFLVTVEGLSYDETAEVLEVPPGTVRSRMKRGRTLLQKALWEHAREAGLISSDEIERHRT
jgi:RNA polymerase sigma-70 factor (ECF subfamily)